MKKTLSCLLLITAFHAQAQQEHTFDRQLEQALTELHRFGTPLRSTVFAADPATPVTEVRFAAITAIMDHKDGFIRLTRTNELTLTLIHADFLPANDLLSVLRAAGVQCHVVPTPVQAVKLVP